MPAKFSLEIARVQASVAEKKPGGLLSCWVSAESQAQTYPWVGGFLVLCENQGVGRGDFVTLTRLSCQKAVQSQRIFPVG